MSKCTITDYGFTWDNVTVERTVSDDKKGWKVITVKTPRGRVELYITKTGLIRVSEERIKDKLS